MAKSKPTKKVTPDQRAASDPEWLKKALASPGMRSKLSDKFLTPELLAQRNANKAKAKEAEFYNSLGDVTKPLTGETAVKYVDTVVDRAYKPQEDAYAASRKAAVDSGAQQAKWSGDYDAELNKISQAALTAQQAAGTGQVTAAQTAKKNLLTDIDALQTRAQQAQAADANVRGAGYSGGSEGLIAEQIAQAKTRAMTQGATQEESARSAAGASEAFMRQLQGVQGMKGREAQDAIRTSTDNTVKKIDTSLADLIGKKADKKIETLGDLRQTERKNYIYEVGVQNQMQQAILNAKTKMAQIKSEAALAREKNALEIQLKQMGIDADSALKMAEIAADDARAAAGNATKIQVANINAKDNGPAKGKLDKAAQSEYLSGVRNAVSQAKSIPGLQKYISPSYNVGGRGFGPFSATLRKTSPNLSQSQIRAAWDLVTGKGLSQQSLDVFKSKGIRVPGGWRK